MKNRLPLLLLLVLLLQGCSALGPRVQELPLPLENEWSGYEAGSFLPAVIPTTGEGVQLATVYVADYSERYLVPYVMGVDKREGIAREVLLRLVDCEANALALKGTEFLLPLPAGTQVLGMTIRNQLAILDLSREFLGFHSPSAEKLAVDALLYTLTEFPTIDAVELRVEGEVLAALPSGVALNNPITRNQRPLNAEAAVADTLGTERGTLYFSATGPAGGLIYFVPVTRILPAGGDPVAAVVVELIQGPAADSGLHGDLPTGTELKSVERARDVVYLDFSAELVSYGGGTARENALLGALVLSLTEIPGIEQVVIRVNGEPPLLPEGTDISRPVLRPLFINPFVL